MTRPKKTPIREILRQGSMPANLRTGSQVPPHVHLDAPSHLPDLNPVVSPGEMILPNTAAHKRHLEILTVASGERSDTRQTNIDKCLFLA